MMKPRILISFTNYTDADLKEKAGYILTSMTKNPNFKTPVPAIAEVSAALDKYSAALIAAASLDRVMVAEKNKSRKALVSLLTQLGMYVMFVANGDAFVLVSSGYSLGKMPEPGKLGNPGLVTLKSGVTSGQMLSSVKRLKYAKMYSHEITAQQPGDEGNWDATHTTTSKQLYNGLVPGKQYWVRVAAIGSFGQVTYSGVSSMYVQ